jgi:dCMP deaminase
MHELDKHFMRVAREAARASDDRNTQVGCVIVCSDGLTIRAANTFPRDVVKTRDERHERPAKYKWIEHAERNAIYSAARRGCPLAGARIYVPWFPCMDCARAIVQSGISELVCHKPDFDHPRWGNDFRDATVLLAEGGVPVRYVCD